MRPWLAPRHNIKNQTVADSVVWYGIGMQNSCLLKGSRFCTPGTFPEPLVTETSTVLAR